MAKDKSKIATQLYKMILKVMDNFGIVKTVLISANLFNQMSEAEVKDLEGYLAVGSSIRWVIKCDQDDYINFYYSQHPMTEGDSKDG